MFCVMNNMNKNKKLVTLVCIDSVFVRFSDFSVELVFSGKQ